MIFARPRPMPGLGQIPQQMPMGGLQQPAAQIPQMAHPGMTPGGIQPGMQLPPELLARLQQMQGGLGGYPTPQMGLGSPQMGIQPLSPASAYSFR